MRDDLHPLQNGAANSEVILNGHPHRHQNGTTPGQDLVTSSHLSVTSPHRDVTSLQDSVTSPLFSSETEDHCISRGNPIIRANCKRKESGNPSDTSTWCGYWRFKPRWLQRFNSPKMLLIAICWFIFVHGFAVNGINHVNIATLERRFQLHSSRVAWMTSSHDLCAGVVAVICGYWGGFIHKGKLLSASSMMVSLGSFIMLLPHLIDEPYTQSHHTADSCDTLESSLAVTSSAESKWWYLPLLILGNCCHGVGAGTFYTIAIPYIDENSKPLNMPLYTGITLAFSALGPACGILTGGLLLNVYVDVGRVDTDSITLKPGDPGWVGAWWGGYLCSALASLTVAPLLLCFPRQLKDAKRYRAMRTSPVAKDDVTGNDARSLRHTARRVFRLLRTWTWVFLTISAIIEASILLAFGTFIPKVIQFQFMQLPSTAAMYFGICVVTGAAFGMFLGGIIPKLLKLNTKGLLKQAVICNGFALLTVWVFMLKCDTVQLTGVNRPYHTNAIEIATAPLSLAHPCNSQCQCSTELYEPLCGSDGRQYFSACHAGCTKGDTQETYNNCTCIMATEANTSDIQQYSSLASDVTSSLVSQSEATTASPITWGSAENGICSVNCSLLSIFILTVWFGSFMTFVGSTAGFSASVRCVPDSDRTLAMGFQQFLFRLLGSVPAPVLLGAIFDDACLVWQTSASGHQGACWVYDNNYLSKGLTVLAVGAKFLSFFALCMSLRLYKSPKGNVDVYHIKSEKESNNYSSKDVGKQVNQRVSVI